MGYGCSSDTDKILDSISRIKNIEAAFEDNLASVASAAEEDAGKFATFVNGTATETVQLGEGTPTPVLRNVVRQIKSAGAELDSSDVSGKGVYADGASGAAVSRTLGERFSDAVNVRDYGAVGDGVTDDTAAFEAAMASGCAVFVPEGDYNVSRSLPATLLTDARAIVRNNDVHSAVLEQSQTFLGRGASLRGILPYNSEGGTVGSHVWQPTQHDRFDDVLYVQHSYTDRTAQMYAIKNFLAKNWTGLSLDAASARVVQTFGHQASQLYRPKASDPVRWLCLGDLPASGSTDYSDYQYLKLVSWNWEMNGEEPAILKRWLIPDYRVVSNDAVTKQITRICIEPTQSRIALIYSTPINEEEEEVPHAFESDEYVIQDILALESGSSLASLSKKTTILTGLLANQDIAWDGEYYYLLHSASSNTKHYLTASNGVDSELMSSGFGYSYSVAQDGSIPVIEAETLFWFWERNKPQLYCTAYRKYYIGEDTSNLNYLAMVFNVSSTIVRETDSTNSFSHFVSGMGRQYTPLQLFRMGRHGYTNHTGGYAASNYDDNLVGYVDCETFAIDADAYITQKVWKGSDPRYMVYVSGKIKDADNVENLKIYRNIIDYTPFTPNVYGDRASSFGNTQSDNASMLLRGMSRRDTKGVSAGFIRRYRENESQGFSGSESYMSFSLQEAEHWWAEARFILNNGDGVSSDNLSGAKMSWVCHAYGDEGYTLSDMTSQIGSSSWRWTDGYFNNLYSDSGSVSSSDERKKDNIEAPSDALMRAWGKVNFKAFQFKDALQKKGVNARIHIGVIAQHVAEAFASEGLNASRYGLFCFDKWEDVYEDVEIVDVEEVKDENGDVVVPAQTHSEKRLVSKAGEAYGIRYEEALALECAYQRWLGEKRDAKIAELEARLNEISGNGSASSGASSNNL